MRGAYRLIAMSAFLSLLAVPFLGRTADAALSKESMMSEINTNIAVLRYLHRQEVAAKSSLALVKAARALTQQQADAMKKLYDAEMAAGNKDMAALYEVSKNRLEGQLKKLDNFNFEDTYSKVLTGIEAKRSTYILELQTREKAYEALFGEKARVDLDFEREDRKTHGQAAPAAHTLNLGR